MPARNTLVQLLAVYATLRATMHSVTDRQTDGQTDNRVMPRADRTATQYDRLKCSDQFTHARSRRDNAEGAQR